MIELSDPERAKLDEPLNQWYTDQRQPDDEVYVLIRCHLGTEDVIEAMIAEGGGTLRGRGTLVRALRARVNQATLRTLARSQDVVGAEMVHRSSQFHVSPYITKQD